MIEPHDGPRKSLSLGSKIVFDTTILLISMEKFLAEIAIYHQVKKRLRMDILSL